MSMSQTSTTGRIGRKGKSIECPECGGRNHARSSFCTDCGAALDGSVVEQDRNTSEDAQIGLGDTISGWLQSSQDLMYGQQVIIAARWILVVAGLMLALWNPDALGELRVQVGMILALAVGNFFLHAQALMKKPLISPVAHLASALDIVVITAIVVVAGGFSSGLYVFYFPALLAISVAFHPKTGLVLAGGAIALYALIAAPEATGVLGASLVMRLMMMGAVAACGTAYWKIERDRRRNAEDTTPEPARS